MYFGFDYELKKFVVFQKDGLISFFKISQDNPQLDKRMPTELKFQKVKYYKTEDLYLAKTLWRDPFEKSSRQNSPETELKKNADAIEKRKISDVRYSLYMFRVEEKGKGKLEVVNEMEINKIKTFELIPYMKEIVVVSEFEGFSSLMFLSSDKLEFKHQIQVPGRVSEVVDMKFNSKKKKVCVLLVAFENHLARFYNAQKREWLTAHFVHFSEIKEIHPPEGNAKIQWFFLKEQSGLVYFYELSWEKKSEQPNIRRELFLRKSINAFAVIEEKKSICFVEGDTTLTAVNLTKSSLGKSQLYKQEYQLPNEIKAELVFFRYFSHPNKYLLAYEDLNELIMVCVK